MPVNCKLKDILNQRGISIRKLASDTGLQFESVRRLYNNETERFPRNILDKLCEYLGVDISDLIVREENKKEGSA